MVRHSHASPPWRARGAGGRATGEATPTAPPGRPRGPRRTVAKAYRIDGRTPSRPSAPSPRPEPEPAAPTHGQRPARKARLPGCDAAPGTPYAAHRTSGTGPTAGRHAGGAAAGHDQRATNGRAGFTPTRLSGPANLLVAGEGRWGGAVRHGRRGSRKFPGGTPAYDDCLRACDTTNG